MENIEDKVIAEEEVPVAESDRAPRTGLVFEFTDEIGGFTFTEEIPIASPAEAKEQGAAEEQAKPEPSAPKPTAAATKKPDEPTELRDEFVLPVGFRSEPRHTPRATDDGDSYRIRSAYVPTFTGVSDSYRMKDEKSSSSATAPSRAANAADSANKSARPERELDPTAEIGGSTDVERVVVTLGSDRIEEPVDENITIYKFVSPEDTEAQRRVIPTAEELMASLDSADVAEDEPPSETPAEPEPVRAEGEYRMPDPTDGSAGGVYTPSYASRTEAPRGASLPMEKKGGLATPEQRDAMKDRFLDSLIATRIRLVTAVLLLLGAFLFEIFSVDIVCALGFGGSLTATLLLDSQLCLCMLLLVLPEVVRAVKYLVRKEAVPELMILLSAVTLVVYTLLASFSGAAVLMHFSVLFGVQVLMAIVATLCRVKADFAAFKLAARGILKSVVDIKRTRDLPRENIALDGRVDEFRSATARVFKTGTLSDFRKNTDGHKESSANVILMLCLSLGLALVTAVVSYFVSGWSAVNAANSLALVVLLSSPAASLLLHKLPLLHAAREAEAEDCAFVGERALAECSDVDVLCYDDTEVFGTEDVTIRKVHLYGKAYNMPKAMQEMYALFSVVGGPLCHVFTAALDRKSEPAVGIRIEPDGISGVVDGHTVAAGTEEYMLRHGIAIPDGVGGAKVSVADSTRVMYGASEGSVYVKFIIRYSFSEEFSMLLPHIRSGGIVPLIYTCDPNINLELLRVLTFGEDIIRVMKKDVPQSMEQSVYTHINSGLMSLGDKTDTFGLLLLGKRYGAFQRSQCVPELVAMLAGGVCGILLSLLGAFSVPVAALSVWQIALGVGLFIRSKLVFKPRKTEKGN